MKQLLLGILAVCMAGCTTAVPVMPKFPDIPKELKTTCPDLTQVSPDEARLSDLMRTVNDNYATYYECKIKVNSWIKWYENQKRIHDSLRQ